MIIVLKFLDILNVLVDIKIVCLFGFKLLFINYCFWLIGVLNLLLIGIFVILIVEGLIFMFMKFCFVFFVVI